MNSILYQYQGGYLIRYHYDAYDAYLRAYIGHYINPQCVPIPNIESYSQYIVQTRNVNTVFSYSPSLHQFFLDFLEICIYDNPEVLSEIPSSYNLLTNIQSVLNLYVYAYGLKYDDKILLDDNLNKIIDGCIEVSKNRLACKREKNEIQIRFDKFIYQGRNYVSYNTLMKVANMCLIQKNTDFFYIKRKYLIYICIKYNIDSFVIKSILEYYS